MSTVPVRVMPRATCMEAVVMRGDGRCSLVEAVLREPGPGEVLVRLEGCGVCASSLPAWEGRDHIAYPLEAGAPGHEGWGEVAAVGDGVDAFSCGDRVVMLSQHAYASHDIAPESMLARIPDSLAGRKVPGEPLACVINIFRRCNIERGQWVAVVGIGFIGTLLVQLAVHAGAHVIALSRRAWAQELARTYGAASALDCGDLQAAHNAVRELTGGCGCECVIEAAGVQSTLDIASALCADGGRLVIAGYHQDGTRRVDMQQWNLRGLDVINAHERDPRVVAGGLREAMQALASGTLDPIPLLTHHLPLRHIARAFELIRTRPDGFMKAVVMP